MYQKIISKNIEILKNLKKILYYLRLTEGILVSDIAIGRRNSKIKRFHKT